MAETLWATLRGCAKRPLPDDYPAGEIRLFSPVDDVHAAIAAVLGEADRPGGQVKVNMYGYDDPELDRLLHRIAGRPHVAFQMSLDRSQAGGVHEKALLEPWASALGTSVAVGESAKHAISHLKVAIVNGRYTISGSTNWSGSGESDQDNELVITRDRAVASQYAAILDYNHAVMLAQMRARSR